MLGSDSSQLSFPLLCWLFLSRILRNTAAVLLQLLVCIRMRSFPYDDLPDDLVATIVVRHPQGSAHEPTL